MADETLIYTSKHYDSGADIDAAIWHDNRDALEKITDNYGCKVKNVLTGFKYIGEQIANLEKLGKEKDFIFGFEESYGYLSGTYVRDKDAIVTAMLICEMATYFKLKGKSLVDFLNELYNKYGYYKNTTLSCEFDGVSGSIKMKSIMENLREKPFKSINNFKVVGIADYLKSVKKDLVNNKEEVIDLPKSNVLSFYLENDNKVIIRPSGTEPKIKVYVTSVGKDFSDAKNIGDSIEQEVLWKLD